ncbi:MAG: UbiX family flavin prenyltransferase [Chloroflexi bacterium]|nr:UbiX family flavin prenyltransferase [Chloroflexota bacterium]MCL5074828.1 UbiX family flavin prenyltransferase [Chloroflexota bacterium]
MTSKPERKRLIVAISGASGAVYGKTLLTILQDKKIETHLIVSEVGQGILEYETGTTQEEIRGLATYWYDIRDLEAPISSGSFHTDGMVIIPCSMRTLAAISHGYSDNLLTRAADVTLKERRSLIVVPREMPLSIIHLENMLCLARAGAIIIPAMPGFYMLPQTIEDMVRHVVGKVLDALRIEHALYKRWRNEQPS